MTHELTIHLSSILKSSTPPAWPLNTARGQLWLWDSPLLEISQTRTCASELPETMNPDQSNLRQSTEPSCPQSVRRGSPVRRDQILIVLSPEPVMIFSESNSTQYTL